jgi:2-hydroxychromene-2-carboxylate isomerase
MITVVSYTIYHSPNSYLGTVLANRLLADVPVHVERRPIYIPRERGLKVADLVGSSEPPRKSSYHREDCARWAEVHGIELHFLPPGVFEERAARWRQSSFDREELPARAYYAAIGSGRESAFDHALFEAAWIAGDDVNEERVVREAAVSVGLDPNEILRRALSPETKHAAESALQAFDQEEIPSVPTWVVNGKRFWGKDRVEWLCQEVKRLLAAEEQ